jgi:hypothetical protein
MPAPQRYAGAPRSPRVGLGGSVRRGLPVTESLGMVRTTGHSHDRPVLVGRLALLLGVVALCCLSLLAMSGCSKAGNGTSAGTTGSAETTSGMSGHMAGPPVEVHVSQATIDNSPAAWVLTTPESAVRSYLTWVSYAYRIGQSQMATPTMTAREELPMDSYCQYNLEKGRLLDQTLKSIAFGAASTGTTSTLLPAKESWTYSYLSVKEGNPKIGGPYSIDYESTYTVVKNEKGDWLVDAVQSKALGTVK